MTTALYFTGNEWFHSVAAACGRLKGTDMSSVSGNARQFVPVFWRLLCLPSNELMT
jgi:hypothetical protein